MPTIVNGRVTYQGGEALPAVGTPAYQQAQSGVIPGSNTPTTPTKKTGLTDRYSADRNRINTNPALNIEKPNENAIRETYRRRNQQYVDAIKSQFEKYIAEDTQAKQDLVSRAYISQLAGGMSGSISGASKEYKAADTGEKKVRATIADREALIAKVMQDGDLRASQEFETRRKEYLASASDKAIAEQELSGNIRKTAEAEIGTLAQGRSYAELKSSNPKLLEQYKKELNMDDDQLQAFFIAKTPEAQSVKLSDGSVVYYQQITDENGKVTMKEVGRLQGSGGKTIKDSRITDEGVQILYDDGSYEIKGGTGSAGPKSVKPTAGAPSSFTPDDVAKGRQVLAQSGRGDGYADPGIYVAIYQKWIEEGGTLKKFTELYSPEEFVDPSQAELLPTFLQPKTKTTTTINTAVPAPVTPATPTTSGRTY